MNQFTYACLLIFLIFGLMLSASLHAEDTYNFYFQKAPGPVTVNRGGAAPAAAAAKPVETAPGPAAAAAQAAPAATSSESSKPASDPAATPAFHNFELAFGYSASGGSGEEFGYLADHSASKETVFSGQYYLGAQINFSQYVGMLLEAFYLKRVPPTIASGSRWDGGAGLVITPIRIRANPAMQVAFSLMGGGMTMPYSSANNNPTPWLAIPSLGHDTTAYYGGRIGFELYNRATLQAGFRRLHKIAANQATISLAYLF